MYAQILTPDEKAQTPSICHRRRTFSFSFDPGTMPRLVFKFDAQPLLEAGPGLGKWRRQIVLASIRLSKLWNNVWPRTFSLGEDDETLFKPVIAYIASLRVINIRNSTSSTIKLDAIIFFLTLIFIVQISASNFTAKISKLATPIVINGFFGHHRFAIVLMEITIYRNVHDRCTSPK